MKWNLQIMNGGASRRTCALPIEHPRQALPPAPSQTRGTSPMIDEICVIRSMHADVPNHEPSLILMSCGEACQARPSLGSWVLYGLGAENQNLLGFLVMCPDGFPIAESQNWQAAFLPGIYQGTYVDSRHSDIEKLIAHERCMGSTSTPGSFWPPGGCSSAGSGSSRSGMARGSRGTITTTWKPATVSLGRQCDQAIGAFLKDLKQRGMLDDTWVVWGFVARDGMTSRASDPFPLLAN